MAAAIVGSVVRGGGGGAASHATSFPQAPTAGNLLLLASASTRTGALGSETVTGWTLLGEAQGVRGTIENTISLFGKWAVGGDSAPTISHTNSATCTWTMEEWSGLSGSFPSGIPETWSMTDLSGGGTTTLNINETADVNNEWVFCIFGGRVSAAGDLLSSWDASDLTASSPTSASGRQASIYTAYGSIATASSVKNFEATAKANSDGGAQAGIGAIGFDQGGGAPAGPTEDVIVGGTRKGVTASSVIVGGSKKVITSTAVIIGGAKKTLI